ncbi:MAG: prepilin-type N-terminal cleavage/methylation domain-containing protein [Armatimonadetes bacterium]|nr:prepilin-type N-terminal cleavage/methylation domain-containing protein [Armatimonadota bacterium]
MANKRRNSGLSLIEVLIAMAIFVIGILAVLRIFPKSLGIITTNRDRADAVRMAQARLEELRADESRLPDAILPAGLPTQTDPAQPDFGFLRLGAGIDANRPYDFTAFAGPNGWTDVNDPQALYRFLAANRLVVGERALVPRGTSSGAEPTYTLFGPIDTTAGAVVEAFREFTQVDPADLRVTQAAGGYQDRPVFAFLDGGIDSFTRQPANDRLLFELDARARQLIVRYAYNNQGRAAWVQAPAGTTALAATAGTPASLYQEVVLTNANVIPGSVSVRQALTHGGGGRFSFDDSGANLGYVRMSTSLAGEDISLEYVARDWRLLHETVTLAMDAGGNVLQPAGGVVTGGMLQLRTTDLDDTFQPLLVIRQTGQQIPLNTALWAPDVAKSGRVPLQLATGLTGLADGTYEVVVWFRRQGNWAVAPSIAPASYILAADAQSLAGGSLANYPVQSMVVEPVVVNAVDSYCELRFRPSEAGRTVLVSYEYNTPTGHKTVSGEPHVVPPQANAGVAGALRHAIRLQRPLEPGGTLGVGADVRPYLHTVEGVSMAVRVVYNDQNLVRPSVPVVTGQPAGDTRQRLYELNWLVRRHR